jgi:hypothetical protein
VSTTVEDHVESGLALLRTNTNLTVYDGLVPKDAPNAYVVVHTFRQRPDGLTAPDKVPLTGTSVAVDMRMYCHCVGSTAAAARLVQGQVEATLLDMTPTVTGRSCFPIRLIDGAQSQPNEETGASVWDNVDVYGWTSVPA